ncbi:MAG: RNA methyltransferase [Acidobacteria bacterium]|nr:RNA methyltransferase [Acidobacteriota bacterium]
MRQADQITSRDNARLVHARKTRDGKVSDEIFLEGLRLVEEALRSTVEIKECFYTPRAAENARAEKWLERLSAMNIPVHEISDALFNSISDTKTSQGIALTASRPETGSNMISRTGADLFVYLHQVNDPSNVGAVFRTAEAAGVNGIILSGGSADAFSTKALRAAMGSNLRVPLWEKAELADILGWAREKGLQTAAADTSGKLPHTAIGWNQPTLVMFGSEAHGLDEEVLSKVDLVFKIEMKNGVESLNLAVSAGIVLFEAVRLRQ